MTFIDLRATSSHRGGQPVPTGLGLLRGSVRTSCTSFKAAPRGRPRRRLGGLAVTPADAPAPARLLKRRSAGAKTYIGGRQLEAAVRVTRPRRFDTGTPRGGSHRANTCDLRCPPDRSKRTSRRPRVKSPLRCGSMLTACPPTAGIRETAAIVKTKLTMAADSWRLSVNRYRYAIARGSQLQSGHSAGGI
jgi:hypothetical protein